MSEYVREYDDFRPGPYLVSKGWSYGRQVHRQVQRANVYPLLAANAPTSPFVS